MKNKIILLALAAFANFQLCNAQRAGEETIYLKNGSIIKGQVTEVIPDKTVTIYTESGSTFVVNVNDIEKYTREPISFNTDGKRNDRKNKERELDNNHTYIEKGYRGFFSGEFQAGDVFQMGATTTHGFQLNDKVFIGAGTGIKICEDDYRRIPLYASIRLDTRNSKISPFVEGRLGYEVIEDQEGGGYASINGGIRVKSFNVSMGFDTFRAYEEKSDYYCYGEDSQGWYTYEDPYTAITFNVRVGFEF